MWINNIRCAPNTDLFLLDVVLEYFYYLISFFKIRYIMIYTFFYTFSKHVILCYCFNIYVGIIQLNSMHIARTKLHQFTIRLVDYNKTVVTRIHQFDRNLSELWKFFSITIESTCMIYTNCYIVQLQFSYSFNTNFN